ncbi:RnfH family protein [Laribacter hongkongensis]|uniref:RnfH family protein n=1 Tax=Laribacter hongkongensis TaxID=168471 RepID=UPI00187801F4|nr:RnfH family protein [Laribacter hongkongensis]MBE5530109.1 RnfH family protein [Laribacter hongkongensis]
MATTDGISVEVAYALPERQSLVHLKVPAGTTAREAIGLSGLLDQYPGIDADTMKIGIFSRPVKADTVLREHDRVEIYRPLIADPKAVRRARAEAGKVMKKGGGDSDTP